MKRTPYAYVYVNARFFCRKDTMKQGHATRAWLLRSYKAANLAPEIVVKPYFP